MQVTNLEINYSYPLFDFPSKYFLQKIQAHYFLNKIYIV